MTHFAVRDHDAEWILQRERLLNDVILDKERRKKRRPRSRGSHTLLHDASTDPTAAGHVRAVVAGLAAGKDATAAELAEVLRALGLLAEPMAKVTVLADRKTTAPTHHQPGPVAGDDDTPDLVLPGRPVCRDTPEKFFLDSYGEETRRQQLREAREICGACPFRSPCLRFALDTQPDDGIWAGTTPRQRRKWRIARDARIAAHTLRNSA
jgi:WhiB family redox-sensing transcriptional regulator